MPADEIIDSALKRGAKEGLAALSAVERKVWLISEAEVRCDIDGIDSFLDHYAAVLPEAAEAFDGIGATQIAQSLRSIHAALPQCPDDLLDRANRLITSQSGYDYDAIARFVTQTA
jgi:hypothetical protein